MIPTDINDTEVLRRTLEDIESQIVRINVTSSTVNPVKSTATLSEVVDSLNELMGTFNNLVGELRLNSTQIS